MDCNSVTLLISTEFKAALFVRPIGKGTTYAMLLWLYMFWKSVNKYLNIATAQIYIAHISIHLSTIISYANACMCMYIHTYMNYDLDNYNCVPNATTATCLMFITALTPYSCA